MQEYRIKRTKEGYDLGYKDIVGLANSFKEFIQQNKFELRYVDLSHANLSNCNLSDADLSHTDLRNCDLRGADFRYCNLRGADLSDSDLRYANLSNCNLSGVDLSNSDLRYADLSGAYFRGHNFYIYRFLKTDDIFEECFLGIGCKTRTIKNWNIFFYDSDEVIQTERNTEDFIKITKEYEEAIKSFKQRFDDGELK